MHMRNNMVTCSSMHVSYIVQYAGCMAENNTTFSSLN